MPRLPALDGLRAVAVLAVVAYHAGLPVPAGFVGVDVFFVISGYLITRLLLAAGDLLTFYARRVRRIFPAAAVVVLAVLGASPFLLDPTQQAHTALSAGAALVFVANVFFQFTSGGYFDASAESMPLLHLWSLSVEEQFYFLWPALIALVPRRWLRPAMIGLALASFALANWLDPQPAFYQMPARAWELAVGGIVATLKVARSSAAHGPFALSPTGLDSHQPDHRTEAGSHTLGVARAILHGGFRLVVRHASHIGLALIVLGCLTGYSSAMGVLPAVAGAVLVIAAVHGGASVRALELRPVVGIGLISYSLYLWHWPLLAFYRATTIGEGSLAVRLALCALAFVLAALSWRYVEQPFRRMTWPKGRTVGYGAAVSVALAVSACAVGMRQGEDSPESRAYSDRPARTCHAAKGDPAALKCRAAGAKVGIWGDSMAFAWTPLAGASDPKATAFTRDACDPFVGYLPAEPFPADVQCREFNALAAAEAAKLDTVILAAWWPEDASLDALVPTLDALRSVRRVVILGPSPHMQKDVPTCIRLSLNCGITRAAFDAEASPVLARLRAMAAKHPNAEVTDVTERFCTATDCPPVLDGVPLYWDTHHVTATVARTYGGAAL